MAEIAIPKKLKPIVAAFFADSPATAKALIIESAKAIYQTEGFDFDRHIVVHFGKN